MRWDYARNGAIDKRSVAALHPSVASSSIKPAFYAEGSEWTLTRRASRLYVVSGEATLSLGDSSWALAAGDMVDLPEGEFELVVGDRLFDVICVFW
jgi:hypothetical protein